MSADNAPVGYTCNATDRVIDRMKDAINYARECEDEETAGDVIYEIENAILEMEEIRDDNSKLREWGNGLYLEKEDLENVIATLENKLEERQDE